MSASPGGGPERPGSGDGDDGAPRPGSGERARTWSARYREGDWVDEARPARIVQDALPLLPREGRALDLACGAGRNALALAERGLGVLAVDLSWEGLLLTRQRAWERSLPVQAVLADVGRFGVRGGSVDVVVNTHFLLREAFSLIRRALAPGGLVVFETYHVDEIDVLGGDIRRAYALESGELRRAFDGFEVLLHEEGVYERDGGERGLARLLARKP